MTQPIERREFLKMSTAAAIGAAIQQKDESEKKPASAPARELPKVMLGKSGRQLPRLGIGCFPLGNVSDEDQGVAIAKHAYDRGIRYFDTAPSYNAGVSERRLGLALAGRDRKEFYLATKTLERGAAGARRELEASLKKLRMDYVDCVQVHEIHDDWELLFKKDSVISGLEKARDEGLLRFIGITCHRDPQFAMNAFDKYEFVSALVPVNPIDPQHLSFTRGFLPIGAKKNFATVAMKIFAGGQLLKDKNVTSKDCLRYAFAQSATILVPGCDSISHVDEAVDVALDTEKPDASWLAAVEKKVGLHRGKATEWYKN
ncbi:MAG: aldo/keto reductase [Planctomycetes bacterium]|nr:aldo/keto reductase [Planctomycetota bacterium]